MGKLLKHNSQLSEKIISLLILLFILPRMNALSVTINSPNNEYVTAEVPIEFTINDSQATSWLVDINYSSSSFQGTGNIIIDDVNFDPNSKEVYDWNESSLKSDEEYDRVEGIDLDKDSDVDIIFLSDSYNQPLKWLENDGSGNFTEHQIYLPPGLSQKMLNFVTGDFDGDGDYDIVVSERYYLSGVGTIYDIVLLQNDGSQNFTSTPIYTASDYVYYLGAGDIDSDGDIDIAFVEDTYSQSSFHWLENDGSGNFTDHFISAAYVSGYPAKLIVADFDNDGDNDILGPHTSYNYKRTLWLNDGAENFTQGYSGIYVAYMAIGTGDIDSDSDLDVIAIYSGLVRWYKNDGTGNFSYTTLLDLDNYSSYGGVKIVDVDGDSYSDIVLGYADVLYWLENDGSYNFTEHLIKTTLYEYTDFLDVDVNDFDNDSDLDILTSSEEPSLSIFYHLRACNSISTGTYRCYYDFDPYQIAIDGNYFLLINVFNGSDNAFDYSSFENDSHSPFTHCPQNNTLLLEDAVFPSLTCNVADPDNDGVLKIRAGNITVDCNGMKLIGDDSGAGIDNNQYDNITIKNCHIQDYRYGIRFSSRNENIDHVVIRDSNFISNSYAGAYLYSKYNSDRGSDYNILNNIFQNNYYGLYARLYRSAIVRNNVFTGNSYYGLYFYTLYSPALAEDNNIYSNYNGAYIGAAYSDSPDGFIMRNNNIYNNSSYYGLYIRYAAHVYENNIYNNNRRGISINYGVEDLIIEDNNIYNNGLSGTTDYYAGIYAYSPRNRITIRDNNISSNGYGVYIERRYSSHDTNVLLENNIIQDNRLDGIVLEDTYDINVVDNNIINNGSYSLDYGGIWIEDSYSTLFKDNNVSSNNGYGIYIYGSDSQNNLIYNNYFSNTINAVDESGNAQDWNIVMLEGTNIVGGSYLGGNYWSDYAGADNDGDYIGDTLLPYNADGNIQSGGDYLPLLLAPAQPTITAVLNYPNGGENLNGTIAIDFNVSCSSCAELHAKLAYSSTAGSFENIIANDLNLNDYANISGLSCDGTDWSSSTNCTYSWDTTQATNGIYYLDMNVWDSLGNYNIDSSDSNFTINNIISYDWSYVAITYSTTNGLKLYINGQLMDSNSAAGSITASDENIVIGYNYDGLIEELKLFTDELNESEIVSDYNAWMNAYYISPVFDANSSSTWTNLGWSQSIEPQYNRIRLQVRACSDSSCSDSSFEGPNGSSSYYTNASENSLGLLGRYFQFKAFLDTNSVSQLPILHSVTAVSYTHLTLPTKA